MDNKSPPQMEQKRVKVTPNQLFLSCSILSIVLHNIFPIKEIIPSPYNLSGIVLILVGLVMNGWSTSFLLNKETTIKVFEKPSNLVTTGPFKISRNPIYLSGAISLLGIIIILGSIMALLFQVLYVILMEFLVIRQEEQILEEIFEEDYLKYKKQVRPWL